MADETRNIDLVFQTNAEQVKAKVAELTSTLNRQSSEYAELEQASRDLADAEFQLVNAQNSVANSSSNTASSQERLRRNLELTQGNYQRQLSSVNSLTTRLDSSTAVTNQFAQAQTRSSESVLKNGGFVAILDSVTGGLATRVRDATEATAVFDGRFSSMFTSFKRATTGMKAALISTGIGALVVLVGTLVTYWDDIKGLVNGVSSEMTKLNDLNQKNVDAAQEKLDLINSQDNILKLQGKSEKDILEIKKKQTAQTITELEALLVSQKAIKDAQIEAAKRNRDILSGVLKFISLPITILLKSIDEVGKAFGKDFGLSNVFDNLAGLAFDPEAVAEEGNKTVKATEQKLNALKNTQAGYELSLKDIQKKGNDERLAKQKEANDKAKALAKEHADKIKAIQEGLHLDIENLNAKDAQAKLDLQKKRDTEEINQLVATGAEKERLLAELNTKYGILQDNLNEENNNKALDYLKQFEEKKKEYTDAKNIEEVEALRVAKEAQLEIDREEAITKLNELSANGIATGEQMAEIDAFYNQKSVDTAKESDDAKAKISELEDQRRAEQLNALGNTLGQAASLFAENTAAYKTLAIAQTTISTYESAVKAYNSLAGVPVVGPGLGIAAAAVAVASGLANVKKILSVKTPGGGGGGSATPSGGGNYSQTNASATPNVNFISSSDNQLANAINRRDKNAQPIKAYVVASEMTEQQSTDAKLADENTL